MGWFQKTYDNGLARAIWRFKLRALKDWRPDLPEVASFVEVQRSVYRWDKRCFEELAAWYFTEQEGADNYIARYEDKFMNPMHVFKTLTKGRGNDDH